MAKSKRQLTKSQRDKALIAKAKKLKEIGAISKQANLHSGRYISRGLVTRVRKLEYILENDYKPVKVPKPVLKKAKDEGWLVVNNRVLAPNDPKFIRRLKSGNPSGIMPVPGGAIYKVELPVNIKDMSEFVKFVESGEFEKYKLDNENFAFTFHGHMSYRAFYSDEDFLQYFKKYESVFAPNGQISASDQANEYRSLQLYRMNPGDWRPPTAEQRRKMARERKRLRQTEQDRRGKPRREKYIPPATLIRYKEKDAERKKQAREKLKQNPDALAEYRRKARERAAASRNKRKQ